MKRIAMLVLLAAFGTSSRMDAADTGLPLPTGMAPTSPSVPAPMLVGGLPVMHVTEAEPTGPRLWSRMASWMPCGKACEREPRQVKPAWCNDCAPAVRHPLPPLPAGLSTSHYGTAPGCGPACAPAARHDGSCCQKLKDWLCFHYTPVRTPLIPTQKYPALYTYFPAHERPGLCATGNCATGNCATGNCATGRCRTGGAAGCAPCPTPGEAIVPGFRLANPER